MSLHTSSFPYFSEQQKIVTRDFNQLLKNTNFPTLSDLPSKWTKIDISYPHTAKKLKKYFFYPKYPADFIFPSMTIYFDEQPTYTWSLGLEQSAIISPNYQPEIIQVDLTTELAFLMFQKEIIVDRLQNLKVKNICSSFQSWLQQFPNTFSK